MQELRANPSDKELDERIVQLEGQKIQIQKKIDTAAENAVSEEEGQKAEKRFDSVLKEWKKRKRLCMDIIGEISEGSGKKIKVLCSSL